MKRALMLALIALHTLCAFAVRDWKVFTNTTHIYDMVKVDNKLYLGTWGGLEVYDFESDEFEKTYTVYDGLTDLDIRSISYLKSTETLLLGTAKAGINRLKNDRFIIPLNETIGLPDNKINVIANSDSLIFVGTNKGLTVFKDSTTFPYPLPINHYATHNGLASNEVNSLAYTKDNYLIIGTDQGFNYVHANSMFDKNSWHHFSKANSLLPDDRVYSVSAQGNTIAIATRGGVVKIQNILGDSKWELYNKTKYPEHIESNEILSLFVDSSENIWLSYGVWNDELLHVENSGKAAITRVTSGGALTTWKSGSKGLRTNEIKGFKEIKGRIYAYSWGEGLYYLEKDSGEEWQNRKPNRMIASNITDISVDKLGKVWVSNGFVGSGVNRKGTRGVSGFDGYEWTNFSEETSPLKTNRIFRVNTDNENRKWFGGWGGGISVYDETFEEWYLYSTSNGLPRNEVGALSTDLQGNIWISAYSGGMVVLDSDAITKPSPIPVLSTFPLYSPNITFSDVIEIFHTDDRVYFGSYYSGLRYWEGSDFPYTGGSGWHKPPVRDLTDGYVYIYAIDSRTTPFGEEIWIAAETGLFMYDTSQDRWYRYGTSIKRELWQTNQWQRERLYFIDEERLYGAVPTFPTALFVDDFDRVWIGTESNGITVYDLKTDRYSVLNTENSPLLSNKITKLAYEPYSGRLYIGTEEGLNSVEIGRTDKKDNYPLSSTIVYPNPFRPSNGETLVIANKNDTIMSKGVNTCRIYDTSGDLIITLKEDRFYKFSWDGNNSSGEKCSSGVYFYVVGNSSEGSSKGTIVLIR
ncbi:MAG: gliding motility-associated C-terminal domain-containing protein [Candidatus Cloacimonadia bacterium]